MRFPGLFGGGDEKKTKDSKTEGQSLINSEGSCARCSSSKKTAKLLIVTGQWNFFYCYRCRGWSKSSASNENFLLPVEDPKMENSLTWFWRTEKELMEANIRAMEWFHSVFTGSRLREDKSNLV